LQGVPQRVQMHDRNLGRQWGWTRQRCSSARNPGARTPRYSGLRHPDPKRDQRRRSGRL